MTFASLAELAQSAASRTGNFAVDVANSAANYACGLYRDYTSSIIGKFAVADAAGVKGFWDTLCAGRPSGLPSPPTRPFTGGQCRCARYGFVLWVRLSSGLVQDRRYEVYGEISGFRLADQPNGSRHFEVNCRGFYFTNVCLEVPIWQFLVGYPSFESIAEWRIQELTRLDGLDNCGDPPLQYPDSEIPESAKRTEITYEYNDGLDLTIPLVYGEFNLEPKLEFNAGGLNFNLDFGGGDVAPPGSDVDLTDVINRLDDLSADVDNVQNDLGDLQDDVDREFDPPPPEDDPELDKEQQDDDDKNEKDIDNLEWLVIDLTKYPDKAQFGTPTCYFAGWICFKRGDDYCPREQINFDRSVFRAVPGATGYAVTFTNRAEGTITTFARREAVENA